MLTTYRRHTKACPHKSRSYWRCQCPIWVQGTLRGKSIRRALDVTSREAAANLIAAWNTAGEISVIDDEPPRIEAAVARYLDDARARHLSDATIAKLTTIFEKQFLVWADDAGLRYLKEPLLGASPSGARHGRTQHWRHRRSTSAWSASSTSACA
jgi:hypothetical protein